MSLSHRVTFYESLTPERGRSPTGSDGFSQVRTLSFSPLPRRDWNPPSSIHDSSLKINAAISAFEIPPSQRVFQIATAVIYCFFAAGIVFGYAALKPILVQQQVYRNRCTPDELKRRVRVCYDQEIHLNLMFTIAAVGTNVAALPIGAILDTYGPRVCGVIASILLSMGALLFACSKQLPFDGFISGYLLLALGGPFVYIPSFQLSNAFPKHSGFVLALLTGSFDSSSAIFLIYRIIYHWSGQAFRPAQFFLAYLVIPLFILLAQIFVMPVASYKTVGELVLQVEDTGSIFKDQIDENTALLCEEHQNQHQAVATKVTDLLGSKSGSAQIAQEEYKNAISGVWGAMHGHTISVQIVSPWFILITLFTIIQMTRINYFVATIRPQYEYLLGSYQAAVAINTFFDLALPVGGLLAIPFIGIVLDHTRTLVVLAGLVFCATCIGVLGCLPYTWAAYANVCLFVVYRPFYYTAVSDFTAKVFGFSTFGTVYGLMICLAGFFNFTANGLDAWCHRVSHGNPVPVNIMLLISALIVGVALCGYVAYMTSEMRWKRIIAEAAHAKRNDDTVMADQSEDRSTNDI